MPATTGVPWGTPLGNPGVGLPSSLKELLVPFATEVVFFACFNELILKVKETNPYDQIKIVQERVFFV